MMNDSSNSMFRATKRKLRDANPLPSDSKKDELIGRLKASLEWSQRETQEHKIMMSQNALFRRVAELTNERNALQAGFCPDLIAAQDELKTATENLNALREELRRYEAQHNHPNPSDIYLKQLNPVADHIDRLQASPGSWRVEQEEDVVTVIDDVDKSETVYTYVNGEWVADG